LDEPQKPPPVTVPVTVEPLMLSDPLRLPVALRLVLISTFAVGRRTGRSGRMMPVRVVADSSTWVLPKLLSTAL
jgi:hypothetical protein